jgi:hypothetical protein
MILLVAIALSTVIPQAYSQIAGSMDETTGTDMGGRNFIVGTVYGPSGQPVNARIRVRLASLRFREVMTSTDDYGKFAFSGLGAGTYTVNVDEDPDYEAVSQQVELQRGPDSYNVSLRLTFKKNAPGRASIFRTENAGVPQKALDLYYKANDLAKAGDRAGAIEQLKLAVAAYPRFMLALTEIGVQYLILGDLAKADEALIGLQLRVCLGNRDESAECTGQLRIGRNLLSGITRLDCTANCSPRSRDFVEHSLLMRRIALHRRDQVWHEIGPALKLNFNLLLG